MSTRDLLMMELYHASRDTQTLALAARHAPILYFDANEPFLPLAAGYTVFKQDGPSPSMERMVELRPEGKLPAALAIEYAIWWDWDIHHLYELEHVWVYLDEHEQPVRVEASWHGKYYEHPVQLENGHVLLLSEPGKHAFAPHPSWFQERSSQFRRLDTLAVGVHAGVLVNQMFAGKIRQNIFDRTLARSYLSRAAFRPSDSFTNAFIFKTDMLVPWETLFAWIPRRVNAWLEHLEAKTQPADYRALRLIGSNGTLPGLQAAAAAGADLVVLPVAAPGASLYDNGALDLDEALLFCRGEPVGVFVEPASEAAVDRLAWLVRTNPELGDYLIVASENHALLSRYRSFVPNGITVVQLPTPDVDPLQAAEASGALFVNPRWETLAERRDRLTPAWVETVREAGLGIVSWPVVSVEEADVLQRLGLDVIWTVLPAG